MKSWPATKIIVSSYCISRLYSYLEGIDTDEQPSKNSCVFIDCKQSNDPCKTKEREDDDESLDEIPACAQVQWLYTNSNICISIFYEYVLLAIVMIYIACHAYMCYDMLIRSRALSLWLQSVNCHVCACMHCTVALGQQVDCMYIGTV